MQAVNNLIDYHSYFRNYEKKAAEYTQNGDYTHARLTYVALLALDPIGRTIDPFVTNDPLKNNFMDHIFSIHLVPLQFYRHLLGIANPPQASETLEASETYRRSMAASIDLFTVPGRLQGFGLALTFACFLDLQLVPVVPLGLLLVGLGTIMQVALLALGLVAAALSLLLLGKVDLINFIAYQSLATFPAAVDQFRT